MVQYIVSAWDHVVFTHHVFLSHGIQQRAYIVFRDLDVWYRKNKNQSDKNKLRKISVMSDLRINRRRQALLPILVLTYYNKLGFPKTYLSSHTIF